MKSKSLDILRTAQNDQDRCEWSWIELLKGQISKHWDCSSETPPTFECINAAFAFLRCLWLADVWGAWQLREWTANHHDVRLL